MTASEAHSGAEPRRTKFSELSVPPALLKELEARGYEEATPVQEAVLAPEHAEGDLLVSSRTGSGKTVAFGLAAAPMLLDDKERLPPAGKPRLLAVAPTRELALQVARELSWLFRSAGGRVATCVGGMDIRREQRALDQGAHIVVGTPGRVCDHLERRSLVLDELECVVLDEADEMLDMGFREELERILDAAPEQRRTLLFSATLPPEIERLAKRYTRDTKRIRATAAKEPHQDIDYVAHLVAPREREHAVVNVLRFFEAPLALVFCATRDAVAHLNAALAERGFTAVALSGELSQAERHRALHAAREGKARVLVATDVAARGLDLPAVSLVIHADLPQNAEVLQHRSGRTGRAGRKGTAVVLAPFPAQRRAERLLKDARVPLSWSPVPALDEVRGLDQRRLIDGVAALMDEVDGEDLEVARALLEHFPAEKLASALVKMERRALPAAEDLPETTAWREAPPRERRAPAGRRGQPYEEGAWFRVNVGRHQKADPRWLLPMLCRRGKVTKRDIGRIEILARETRFEVAPSVATKFERAAQRPDDKEPGVRIERAPPPRRRR